MLKLRLMVVALLLWLAALFNIERLHKPINLASFVYVFAGLSAIGIILIPKLRRVTLVEITLVSLPVYAFIKWGLGYSFLGPQLPITITECVVLCVTNVLAWCVAHQIDEYMQSAAHLSSVYTCENIMSLDEAEGRLYGEVQRARRFQRKLSLATVTFSGNYSAAEIDRLAHHARMEIARRYLDSKVATRLSLAASPGDIVAYRDGEFVLLFPEADESAVRSLLQSVADDLYGELGLRLRAGIAQFPDQEITLTGLIERAEAETQTLTVGTDGTTGEAAPDLDDSRRDTSWRDRP